MFSLRVGTFDIPIWFKCFKNISNNDAFKLNTVKKGIESVFALFKNTDFKLVFLADRWFGSSKILDIINKLGHIYAIRLKGNIVVYLNNEKLKVKKLKHPKALKSYFYRFGSIETIFKTQKSHEFNLEKFLIQI